MQDNFEMVLELSATWSNVGNHRAKLLEMDGAYVTNMGSIANYVILYDRKLKRPLENAYYVG